MSPSDIVSKVPQCFAKALESGDLLFFPSTIHKHEDSEVEFELRLCPALQNKPHLPTPHFEGNPAADAGLAVQGDKGKAFDPFAPPHNPNLHVGDLRDDYNDEEYVVLLNKYAVVPQHFLLVTKEFKSQASPLMPSELLQSYLIIDAARKAGKPVFAFYNCGDNSGASQPHKHIQFIPLDSEDGPPIERVARTVNVETPTKPFALRKLPYANHAFRLPPHLYTFPIEKLEDALSHAFLSLLDLGVSTIRHDPEYPPGKPSYNVIITLEHMYLIPRRQENHILEETGDKLSVNALGFAGMLLVKSEREMEAVKKETPGKILRGVGLESVEDILIAGTSQEDASLA
ncbi:ATP adenylyltransferase-domain-containing protein [Crucibulum laeve]|uniref:ATP adenylyltransferase-domain-containing protein n=1 Tax=Crucibulum laeve TaxID=68775 RepID=A0A5C3MKC1_9AGAR|nr:ATP adenylyltransferase-domain-containing protein [Crucibulum laeve]